jgi:hypothetical protein
MDKPTSEKGELQALQAEFRRLAAFLDAFTKVRANDAAALDQLGTALKRLPPGLQFGQAVDEVRAKATEFFDRTQRERIEKFRRLETEFIKNKQAANESVRQTAAGWRVGPLELEVKREQGRAHFLYNHEPLTDWVAIAGAEDLVKLEQRASKQLTDVALPEGILVDVLWDSFRSGLERLRVQGKDARSVPIRELYREVRVSLVRHELSEHKPDRRLQKYLDFPVWAFLYNLDRYVALGSQVPTGKHLGLESGSMDEVKRGLGMSVNGLDAQQDYRTVCHVISRSGDR